MLTAFDRTVFLARHQYGDWGDLPPSDWWYNNMAAQSGERDNLFPDMPVRTTVMSESKPI